MLQMPSRRGLQALTEATNSVTPAVTIGLARPADETCVSVVYSHPHGMGEFVLAHAEVPAILRAHADGIQQTELAMSSQPAGAVEWHLRKRGVHRLVSLRVPQFHPEASLWIGLS